MRIIKVNKMNQFTKRRNVLLIDSVSRNMGLIVFLLQTNIICLAQEDVKLNKVNTEHGRPKDFDSMFSPGKYDDYIFIPSQLYFSSN